MFWTTTKTAINKKTNLENLGLIELTLTEKRNTEGGVWSLIILGVLLLSSQEAR
ncbi:hypothetical protein Pf1_01458 [Flavobacterium columnare]|nr:hypothetical protein Pf1_01458 [Flavobacterium columnare]GEM59003.1 hypothetical protein FC1_22410 [Flavobacterium columnare NBRC 100251 = ATCC 23463]